MKNNIGTEKTVFVLEVKAARRAAPAASASACPPEATWFVEAMTICCFGQITNQTFKNINVPISPPTVIVNP
jgi:hypothetical protein